MKTNEKNNIIYYSLGLFLSISGLVIIASQTNWYVSLGIFFWTWANNFMISERT